VLALDSGGIISCLATRDGSTRWSDQLTGVLTRFLSLDRAGNQAQLTSESELFVLDMATGNLSGRQEFARLVSTKPIPYGTNLIYGSGVGEVFAHVAISAVQRAKAWGHLLPAGIDRNLVLIGDTVGVVSRGGDVAFLDASSGALVGRNSMYKGSATHPVADSNAMYVASLDQSVYAFNPVGGRLIWQHRTSAPLEQQPAVYGKTLFVEVAGSGLLALDTSNGQPRWTASDVSGAVVAVNGNRLLVWDGKTATLVDPERGAVIERAELPRVKLLVPDKFDGGNLYAVGHSGVVARFLPR
jgi:outer membrane protein assembly factor BamB